MAIYNVQNQTQLDTAILALRGGDKLVIASGAYAELDLNATMWRKSHLKFDTPVSIVAEDLENPPVFAKLSMMKAANIKIEGLKFDFTGQAQNSSNIWESSKITIADSTFVGNLDQDGYGTGAGLTVTKSSDIAVIGNEVSNFRNGVNFWGVENLLVLDNDISGTKNDASTFSEIIGGRIEGNVYHDAHSPSSLAHKDSIQFWTNGNQIASKNIIIRDNSFSNAEAAHTIYMGNDAARSDSTKAYQNILVEDNTFKTGHIHGIVIEHVDGAVIRDNLLERFPGLEQRQITTPVITVGVKSQNVSITGNTVASLQREADATWDISDNTITAGSRYAHWEGGVLGSFYAEASEIFKAWTDAGVADPDVIDLEEMLLPADAGPQSLRFDGDEVNAAGRKIKLDFDFEAGDVLLLKTYEEGTFGAKAGGNYLEKGTYGRYARINSVVDLAELAAMSDDVEAWVTVRNELVVQIDQDRGVDTFTFRSLGDEFNIANNVDFF